MLWVVSACRKCIIASSVEIIGGASGPCSAWRLAPSAWVRSTASSAAASRAVISVQPLVDCERDATDMGLGVVGAAVAPDSC